jgi:hypothetical protein
MIVLHVCHTPPFPFLLGYASCLHVTCKDNVLPVQRGLRGDLKTFLNFFFSPPQVANGAQAEGLERWDAALEVSVMCLFVVLMMASFLFCRQPLSPAEWEWQARLPV